MEWWEIERILIGMGMPEEFSLDDVDEFLNKNKMSLYFRQEAGFQLKDMRMEGL